MANRRKRDPNSWMVVRLPERDLSDCVLDLATPSLERLGPSSPVATVHAAIELVIDFWNAQVHASQYWGDPRPKALNELRKKMTQTKASPEDREVFGLLSERWRETDFRFDPRLVADWSLEFGSDGRPQLSCEVGLPDGVRAEIPPPIEERVGVGGSFLDEVRIPTSSTSYLGFPVEAHRGDIGSDGVVTIRTKMPTAVALFAKGLLPSINGAAVELIIGGRALPPMILTEVYCLSNGGYDDGALLVFGPRPDDND